MFERGEQVFIEAARWQATMESLSIISDEAFALLPGMAEFLKAIGEFDAIAIELEAQSDARVLRVKLGECCLRGGVMRQCDPSLSSQRGSERHTDQKIEKPITRQRSRRIPRQPMGHAAIDQLASLDGERVDAKVLLKRILVAKALERSLCASGGSERRVEELGDLVDQCIHRPAD